jgi:triosephosphate isomerase
MRDYNNKKNGMSNSIRRLFVGGNWKCNGTLDFARKFPNDVLRTLKFDPTRVQVVVAPANIHITTVQSAL